MVAPQPEQRTTVQSKTAFTLPLSAKPLAPASNRAIGGDPHSGACVHAEPGSLFACFLLYEPGHWDVIKNYHSAQSV